MLLRVATAQRIKENANNRMSFLFLSAINFTQHSRQVVNFNESEHVIISIININYMLVLVIEFHAYSIKLGVKNYY